MRSLAIAARAAILKMMTSRWPLLAIVIAACGSPTARPVTTMSPTPTAKASAERRTVTPIATTEACAGAALRFEHGVEKGLVCPADAAAQRLTIVDLADAWTPRLFAIGADGTAPAYRDTYLKLAAEHDKDGKPVDGADALGELYGVVPSLAIVRERLADRARHACHAAIEPAPIAALDKPYGQDFGPLVAARARTRVALEKRLERERVRRALPDFPSLASVPKLAPVYARWKQLADLNAGLITAHRRLACEGFLPAKLAGGAVTWRTSDAVELFQRRNFLMPNERLDAETRAALLLDSRELDFRLALRVLRERVVDATGLLEDGTAGAGPQPILERVLDPDAMRAARGRELPLPNAAPDLISPATEAAAKHLGWTSADQVQAFLERHAAARGGLRVALALPPVPAYHAPHMALSAEIDRGDVWYDPRPIRRKVKRRPTLVVYVDDAGTKRPLVRWPTTIGGWSDVRTEAGWVHQRWKESDVGPRVWRELYAAPTWLPPKSTPDKDLVKNLYNGRWELKRSIMGPGPHAAYGMVLLVHDNVVEKRNGEVTYWDNGIGSHGSSSVTSIVNGTSHGCHRLFNQLAVRLGSFLLRHRDHVVKGQQAVKYRRVVAHRGRWVAKVDTRGFLYELTPPVPIRVLEGTIKSKRKIPPKNAAPASE